MADETAETAVTQSTDDAPRSAADDLALIRAMMAAGRRRAGINGSHLILWGALLAAAFFSQYASYVGWLPGLGNEIWIVMTAVGWAGSIYLGRKNGRPCNEHNPALEAYGSAWMGVGITMLLFLFATAFGKGQIGPSAATMLSSGVIGSAFFVMGMVLKMRPMFMAAAGWWAMMVYVIVTPRMEVEILLVLTAAALLLILGPGVYLQRLAKSEGAAGGA